MRLARCEGPAAAPGLAKPGPAAAPGVARGAEWAGLQMAGALQAGPALFNLARYVNISLIGRTQLTFSRAGLAGHSPSTTKIHDY